MVPGKSFLQIRTDFQTVNAGFMETAGKIEEKKVIQDYSHGAKSIARSVRMQDAKKLKRTQDV